MKFRTHRKGYSTERNRWGTIMIYLDNAATTKMSGAVLEKMMPYLTENYGNPAALYLPGSLAKKAVSESRRTIAKTLGVLPEEIFFTSGGSESDNWALTGAAMALKEKGRHIITTQIEHHAVINTCKALEKQGFQVTYLPVDEQGRVDVRQLRSVLRSDTILISVMAANNEVGTIQSLSEIGEIAGKAGVLFHTDAVQMYGHLPIPVREWGIDLLSASGHKFHGPKGTGFLYIRKGVKIAPLIYGGGQESGNRAGTENVAGIAGLGEAARIAHEKMEENQLRMKKLRDHLEERLLREIPGCLVNGREAERLPGTLSVCIPFVEGESVLIQLDMKGICASGGSACTIGSREPSHVLTAMGRSALEAKGSLRFTVSEENTMEEMDETADAIREIVEKLRELVGYRG